MRTSPSFQVNTLACHGFTDVMENWWPLGWRQRTLLLPAQRAAQLAYVMFFCPSSPEVGVGGWRHEAQTGAAGRLSLLQDCWNSSLGKQIFYNGCMQIHLTFALGEDIAFILWGQINLPSAPEGDSSFQVCLFYKHLWKDSWCLGTSFVVQWLRLHVSRADGVGSIPGAGSSACSMV